MTINWVENKNLLLGLAIGLLMAGSVSDRVRLVAAATSLAAAVICIVMSRRQNDPEVTT